MATRIDSARRTLEEAGPKVLAGLEEGTEDSLRDAAGWLAQIVLDLCGASIPDGDRLPQLGEVPATRPGDVADDWRAIVLEEVEKVEEW